jgi:hypothetical protein
VKVKIISLSVVILGLFLAVGSVSAAGQGNSPARLDDAGWFCFLPTGEVHCIPPGALSSDPSIAVKVFETDDLGYEYNDTFLGTERLIRADLWEGTGQSCPQDEPIPGIVFLNGITYVGCHQFSFS